MNESKVIIFCEYVDPDLIDADRSPLRLHLIHIDRIVEGGFFAKSVLVTASLSTFSPDFDSAK